MDPALRPRSPLYEDAIKRAAKLAREIQAIFSVRTIRDGGKATVAEVATGQFADRLARSTELEGLEGKFWGPLQRRVVRDANAHLCWRLLVHGDLLLDLLRALEEAGFRSTDLRAVRPPEVEWEPLLRGLESLWHDNPWRVEERKRAARLLTNYRRRLSARSKLLDEFPSWVVAALAALFAAPSASAPGGIARRPLSDVGRAVLEMLCAQPETKGLSAKEIVDTLGKLKPPITVSGTDRIKGHVRRELEPYGIANKGKGYYIPLDRRPSS